MIKSTGRVNNLSDTVKLAIVFVLWAAAFYPVYPGLVDTWLNHSDNSHGLLVPFIALYFVWESREGLNQCEVSPSRWGVLILVGSLLVYLLAYLGGTVFVTRAMMVFSLAGLVLYVFGKQVFRALIFPLVFLMFMVPVPDSIIGLVAFPLQLFATKVSAEVIQACSIPIYREGNMLFFVHTQLEVAEACSGIRSIMALTMLSMVFVYFSKKGFVQKLILIVSAIPIALLANILRISGTGILAHFWGDQVARGFLHEFSGMVVFVFGMALLFAEFALLNKFLKAR